MFLLLTDISLKFSILHFVKKATYQLVSSQKPLLSEMA